MGWVSPARPDVRRPFLRWPAVRKPLAPARGTWHDPTCRNGTADIATAPRFPGPAQAVHDAWAENFVAFDPLPAEELWCAVERRVPAASSAVHAGAPFADPLHVAALHDLIVLHYVRSYHYRRVHHGAFAQARVGLVGELVRNYPAQLGREALRGHVLQGAGHDVDLAAGSAHARDRPAPPVSSSVTGRRLDRTAPQEGAVRRLGRFPWPLTRSVRVGRASPAEPLCAWAAPSRRTR